MKYFLIYIKCVININRVLKIFFINILTPSYKTLHTNQIPNSEVAIKFTKSLCRLCKLLQNKV